MADHPIARMSVVCHSAELREDPCKVITKAIFIQSALPYALPPFPWMR